MILGLAPSFPGRVFIAREILPLGRILFLAVPVDFTLPAPPLLAVVPDVALFTVPDREGDRGPPFAAAVGFGVMDLVEPTGVIRPLLTGAAGIKPLATGRVEFLLAPPLFPVAPDHVFAPPLVAMLLTLTKLLGSSSLLESAPVRSVR